MPHDPSEHFSFRKAMRTADKALALLRIDSWMYKDDTVKADYAFALVALASATEQTEKNKWRIYSEMRAIVKNRRKAAKATNKEEE